MPRRPIRPVADPARAEISSEPTTRGAVAAVLQPNKPDSGGAQFFVCVSDQQALSGKFTVFGRVSEGMDVVQKISEAAATPEGLPAAPVQAGRRWPTKPHEVPVHHREDGQERAEQVARERGVEPPEPAAAADTAARFYAQGVRDFKVKAGPDPAEDLRRIAAVAARPGAALAEHGAGHRLGDLDAVDRGRHDPARVARALAGAGRTAYQLGQFMLALHCLDRALYPPGFASQPAAVQTAIRDVDCIDPSYLYGRVAY